MVLRRLGSGRDRPILGAVSEATIHVRVRLFAAYREAARTNRLEADLPAGATVADLVEQLAQQVPALKSTSGLVAVNQAYVRADHRLGDGDEVAFIPPVSGGQGGS